MKINREEFLKELEAVLAGLSSREIIEQSSCFVFKDKKVFTYNDEIACSLDSCLRITGAVQATPLVAILRKLKEEELTVTENEGEIVFQGKGRRTGIRMEEEIMLPIDSIERPKKWKDLPEDFAEGVAMVCECASKNESHFELTCIHITPKWIEACDNYQASRYRMLIPIKQNVLIRRESLKYISALEMTEFSETKKWIHFRNAIGLILSCRRYVEEFPSIGKVLKVKGVPVVLPKGLKDAAEKAEIFSAESAEDSSVSIHLKKNKLRIKGVGASGFYEEIKRVKYDGKDLRFRIPPKLLIEVIQRHTNCQITKGQLKIKMGKLTYVTALDEPK